MSAPVIVWFRQDLRLADNPAFLHATEGCKPVLCIYILDDETARPWAMGGASRWWLHHSLTALDKTLKGKLVLRRGRAEKILPAVAKESGADEIVWNRCYEPYAVARDTALKKALTERSVKAESFNASLLCEPWQIQTKGGAPFRVFTPFWRALRTAADIKRPTSAPKQFPLFDKVKSDRLDAWGLLPTKPNWASGFAHDWTPGEAGAQKRLGDFVDNIRSYGKGRDIPGKESTSRLSPHLHFGEISPRQIWHAVQTVHEPGADEEKFLSEIGWREFSYHLLFHNPTLPEKPLDRKFESMSWRRDAPGFTAWSKGQTGVPIVDAGMRQLWQTGWMHNRVRMIVASFLIKHLLIDWRKGENWFWDTLVDADLANNAASWQWVAGCGADASPFFRIFNPVLQGEKFDTGGSYVRRFVPEIAKLPDKYLHKPWDAPEAILSAAQIELGKTYPKPIANLGIGRERALEAFRALKG